MPSSFLSCDFLYSPEKVYRVGGYLRIPQVSKVCISFNLCVYTCLRKYRSRMPLFAYGGQRTISHLGPLIPLWNRVSFSLWHTPGHWPARFWESPLLPHTAGIADTSYHIQLYTGNSNSGPSCWCSKPLAAKSSPSFSMVTGIWHLCWIQNFRMKITFLQHFEDAAGLSFCYS